MKFSELQLEPKLLQVIEKVNFVECTPIQEAAIPIVQSGKDLAGLAQTGTGKTGAFLIPLIDRILKGQVSTEGFTAEQLEYIRPLSFSEWKRNHFILVLVPTRELAEQVLENTIRLGQDLNIKACAVYGGTGYDKQKQGIKDGVEFIIATPGRLIDLYKEHIIDLKQVRAIVFDEADRMFDMGFKDDMKYILQRVPRERQFLVFSATLNFDVLNTAYQFGAEPVEVAISRDQAKAENVKDEIFHVGHEEKPKYLLSLLKRYNPKQTIIFSNFKFNVERISKFLNDNQYPSVAISSLLTQSQRNKVIEQFKAENEHNILVATDVAARGLDIKGVDLVINYELPMDSESYVHRIGRTGRAGTEGKAFSLVCDKDVESLSRIEDYLKNKLSVGWLEESDMVQEFKKFPRENDAVFADRRREEAHGGGGSRGESRGESRGGGRSGGRSRDGGHSGGHSSDSRSGEGRGSGRRQPSHHRAAGKDGSTHSASEANMTKDQSVHGKDRSAQQHRHKRPAHHDKSGADKPYHKHSDRPRAKFQDKPYVKKPHPANKHKKPTSVVGKVKNFFKNLFG